MNKLTKISLIAAILTSGAMAGGSYIPQMIAAGGTLIINKDMNGNASDVCDVYGKVITELEKSPYPTVSGGTFKIHKGSKLEDITTDALLEANPVDGVEKVHDYKTYNGYFDDRITAATEVVDKGADKLSSLTEKDLVLLATSGPNQQLVLNVGSGTEVVKCHFGDGGATDGESCELVIDSGGFQFQGNFDNFKNGKILVSTSVVTHFEGSNFYVPITCKGTMYCNNVNLYGELTCENGGKVETSLGLTIQNGGVLRIGTAD